jgi:hypothetical protein
MDDTKNIINDIATDAIIDTTYAIDNKLINQITLECLINKEIYKKYLASNNATAVINNKKDRKFYRKRILQLTRDILLNDNSAQITNDITFVFESYVNLCIQYFKMVDKVDLIQQDHYMEKYTMMDNSTVENFSTTDNCSTLDNSTVENNSMSDNIESADKLLLRSIKLDAYTLDKFVKVISTKKDDATPLPVQKIFNLKDPMLRNKGIRKKKNVDNKYEELVKTNNDTFQNEKE